MRKILIASLITLCNVAFIKGANLLPVEIINISDQKLHFSYENKFGEIKGVWVDGFKTHQLNLETGKQRVVFEYNGNMFPCIVNTGNKIYVERKGNHYEIKNSDNSDLFYQLSEQYSILRSPFSGIDYTTKTDYGVIAGEILKYKNNRLELLKNSKYIKDFSSSDIKLLIEFRYLDELLAPFHQEKFHRSIVPFSYKQLIDEEVVKLKRLKITKDQTLLVKNYYWGILRYKLLNEENINEAQSKIIYIQNLSDNENLKNYLLWRLYQDEYLLVESKKTYESYFRNNCNDKDYLKRIDLSWK